MLAACERLQLQPVAHSLLIVRLTSLTVHTARTFSVSLTPTRITNSKTMHINSQRNLYARVVLVNSECYASVNRKLLQLIRRSRNLLIMFVNC